VGFGPGWSAEDSMAASIVRLECEADELRAEVAMLQEQARIITEERDEARIQYRSTHALAEALVNTIGKLKAERVELKATINTYRDEACRESCRDKAAADGGWANI
jgi:cell division protein FtsB